MNDLSSIVNHIEITNKVINVADKMVRDIAHSGGSTIPVCYGCSEILNLIDELIGSIPKVVLTYDKAYNKFKNDAILSFSKVLDEWMLINQTQNEFIDAWVDFLEDWALYEDEVIDLKENGKTIYLSMN